MASELNHTSLAFARLSYRQLHRRLVFQRLPKRGESQNDSRGFPLKTYSDIDASNPIPCNFTLGQRRDLLIEGQERSVTTFKVTIPSIYNSGGNWIPVDFSTNYRAHILAKDSLNPERFFQVIGSGDDLGPDITFEAIEIQS